MLNDEKVWDKVLNYEFEKSPQEYGFITRLAFENQWTEDFTSKAVLEYKKFMYLISTNEEMFSPCEIVDIVWHQHLIYSDSYQEFCSILGKEIKHLPSTHNEEEEKVFKKAFQLTEQKYKETFGSENWYLWQIRKDTDLLQLHRESLDNGNFVFYAFGSLILLTIFFTTIGKPIFLAIENPYFLLIIIIFFLLALHFFKIWMRTYFDQISQKPTHSPAKYLNSLEVITIKENKIRPVIYIVLQDLVNQNQILIKKKNVTIIHKRISKNPLEKAIRNSMQKVNPMDYYTLLGDLLKKKTFLVYAQSTNKLINTLKTSKEFQNATIYSYAFFIFFGAILLSRLSLGIGRDRPIFLLCITIFIFTLYTLYFIKTKSITYLKKSVINLSKKQKSIKAEEDMETVDDLGWQFLALGSSVLVADLLMPETKTFSTWSDSTSTSVSSCGGSSCSSSSSSGDSGGSSCGSSCGGCGGGGD